MNKSGIYCIENTTNNKLYIGQSNNLKHRKQTHFSKLKHNNHVNSHLQNAYNKYGKKYFKFNILLYCEPFELTRYEQFFVDKYKEEILYNICIKCVDSTFGVFHSEKTKKKLSKIFSGKNNPMYGKIGKDSPSYGRKITNETKQKLSKSLRGNTNMGNGETHYNFNKKSKNTSSKYYGVSLSDRKYNYWIARIKINGEIKYIGKFKSELEAALAYDEYIIEQGFTNRKLNFPKIDVEKLRKNL